MVKVETGRRVFYTYDLVKGRGNRVVYRGFTHGETDGKASWHRANGMKFDRIVKTSRRMTIKGVLKKHGDDIRRYKKHHGGRLPYYNERMK